MGKRIFCLILLSLGVANAQTTTDTAVDALLALATPPVGVVFEVVSGNPDALQQALPQLEQAIGILHTRYPALPIALVSHGREQFSLAKDLTPRYHTMQTQIKALVEKQQVKVQVCGTNAKMHDVDPSQFPEYVEVVARGPRAVDDFIARGYRHILMR